MVLCSGKLRLALDYLAISFCQSYENVSYDGTRLSSAFLGYHEGVNRKPLNLKPGGPQNQSDIDRLSYRKYINLVLGAIG